MGRGRNQPDKRVRMKSGLRVGTAAVALAMGLVAPAWAQDQGAADSAPISIAPPPPTADDAVGPAQLRDFSLGGTVTRRAETPATASPQPAPAPTARVQAAPAESRAAPAVVSRTAQSPAASTQRPATAVASVAPGADTGFNFTPSTPATGQSAGFTPQAAVQPASTPLVDTYAATEANLFSHWPWLLALLAAGGAALWYFRRQRGGYAFAGAGAGGSAFEFSPSPQPSPAPPAPPRAQPAPPPVTRAPVPAAAPSPPPATAPVGIISTRLRPWLELEFQPLAAVVDAEKGEIEFQINVYNSGSAPARDVLVEASLFNAGTDQDEVIGQFFARPAGPGDRVPMIPPLQRMEFRHRVKLPRDQLRLFDVEGRSLFVPIVGFNAHYRWSGGDGQSSVSYIVGRNTDGQKMAPFQVGDGPKAFRGLGAREHTLTVRK